MTLYDKLKRSNEWVPIFLQAALNIALVLLAAALCLLLGKELFLFIRSSITSDGLDPNSGLLESILIFFLYFEFIAMIVRYFREHHHFPIRYFLYIGITAMIRLIIVYHTNAIYTFFYSCSILVLIIGYFIMNSATARKGRL